MGRVFMRGGWSRTEAEPSGCRQRVTRVAGGCSRRRRWEPMAMRPSEPTRVWERWLKM